ncbi:MAG: DUF4430 domain-containing protein [Clostridia bacterium]|nr:DUF4430 domain-containing protein [Clostridia bacterium]
MKMTRLKKSLSLIVCIVLIAAMALCTFGCSDNTKNTSDPTATQSVSTEAPVSTVTEGVAPEPTNEAGAKIVGTGSTVFTFDVTDADKNTVSFEVHTDKTTVGDALTELGLISGEEGAYGLYVKTVNGITVDYDKDGKYWAFYINGEYAMTGVDKTDITAGAVYSFKVE